MLLEEARKLDSDYEKKFPGISTHENGTTYTEQALETMKGWKP